MTGTFSRRQLCLFAAFLALGFGVPSVWAEPATFDPAEDYIPPDGIHILDGSYVLNVGELQVNITNHGLIGSQYSADVPYSQAPSGQWPGGSGDEYLWSAGLWVGGRLNGQVSVSTGQYEREFRPGPRLRDTIYEAQNGYILRPTPYDQPTGMRMPSPYSDDDFDNRHDEDFLNGLDDDGDGQVDEDFAQLGDQMFTCTMFDNLRLISEVYPSHRPLGLRVIQRAFAFYQDDLENIIGLDFEITNVGYETVQDTYLGFFVDCDIQARSDGSNEPNDMAGMFSGAVRAENGIFYRADIAYMMDGAEEDPLPGCFGVMLIDHTTEFLGREAPFHPEVNSFQIFATNASVNQEGEPQGDSDRYYLMSRNSYDRNTLPDEATDMKFMISSGPFTPLRPGDTLEYKLAMIVGDGLQGMLETAVEAGRLGAGSYYNLDGNWWTGRGGRETKVCLGDYPTWETGEDPIYGHRLNFMNEDCAGSYPIMFQYVVNSETLEQDNDGRYCVWVNMDNCEECFRYRGYDCTPEVFHSGGRIYTGTYGREAHYPWSIFRETPPPSPGFRVTPGDNQVEIYWDDRSEHTLDPARGVNDFESYRVWKVHHWTRPPGTSPGATPPAHMWGMIEEYDLINFIPPGIGGSPVQRTLGRNTGLEDSIYVPACLSDPRFDGLAEQMQAVVDTDTDGQWISRPPLRSFDGSVIPGMEGLMPWEMYPDVLDTFFAVTGREEADEVVGKRSSRYYHYLDTDSANGFLVYYAVVAADHQLTYVEMVEEFQPGGYGTQEDPGNNFQTTTPRPEAQTVAERQRNGQNIYVYPNPATAESLQEYLAQAPSHQDPTGVRVTWNNLPRAHNTIHIFTESGDLVYTMQHDGFNQGGSTSWNLISRNGQEIISGIYLYVVKSDNSDFPDFQGRFIVIN